MAVIVEDGNTVIVVIAIDGKALVVSIVPSSSGGLSQLAKRINPMRTKILSFIIVNRFF
jgi:hypothetical protein